MSKTGFVQYFSFFCSYFCFPQNILKSTGHLFYAPTHGSTTFLDPIFYHNNNICINLRLFIDNQIILENFNLIYF